MAERAKAHPARFVLYIFTLVNLAFTTLLLLPRATETGQRARFVDALFTAVSSVCVTGLTVHDTGSYWSGFGHVVILSAIAVGGLLTRFGNQPINEQVMSWTTLTLPPDWQVIRDRWVSLNGFRLIASFGAELLLVSAIFAHRS